ncbi:MAG: GGDEF domain-containing response regulator [Alphaproteobacteria bacterium]
MKDLRPIHAIGGHAIGGPSRSPADAVAAPRPAGPAPAAREPRAARILLACNNPSDRDMIASMLASCRRGAYEIDWFSGYGAALRAVEERRHDILLIDMRLDSGLGPNLLREAVDDGRTAPAILFAVPQDSGIEAWALGTGAADCLFEGELNASLLDRVLAFASERQQTAAQLDYLGRYDPETGLANRRQFRTILDRSIARARRRDSMVAVFLVGLDRFKFAGESIGRASSDQLLPAIVRRLETSVPETTVLARLGDDTFGLILDDLSALDDAEPVAKRISQALSVPLDLDGSDVYVAASIGIATFPLCGWDADTLAGSAATAMSRARVEGHNCYQFHTRKMTTLELQRLVLQTGLHRALERREFILHYQPQIDLRTGRMIGVEALVRWRHRDLGLLLPNEFIPVAEDTGLIIPLGRWVLSTACRQIRLWQEDGLPPLRLAINVAQRQFREATFPDTIATILSESGLPPEQLAIELTESTLMEDKEASHATLARFRAMGVGVFIDDFGTGYSSLSYLKRFPLDALKIDKSFVADVTTDAEDAAIATAVIGLAHSLRLNVIAEGVETADQLAFLKAHDCDAIQGDYISHPLAPDTLAAFARERRG